MKIIIVIPETYRRAGINDISFVTMKNKILSEGIYADIEYLFCNDTPSFSASLRDTLHTKNPSGVILIGHTGVLGVPKVTVTYAQDMNLDWVYAIPKSDWLPKSNGYLVLPEIENVSPSFWVSRITPEKWGGGGISGCWEIKSGIERYIKRRSLFPQITTNGHKIPLILRFNFCQENPIDLSTWHNLPSDPWYNKSLSERDYLSKYAVWDFKNHFDSKSMTWNTRYLYQSSAANSLKMNSYNVWLGHGNKYDLGNYVVDYMIGNFEPGYESIQIANSCNAGTPSLAKKVGEGSLCVAANILNSQRGSFNKLGVMAFIGVGAENATSIDTLIPTIPESKSIGEAVMKAFLEKKKFGIPACENDALQLTILGDGCLPI